MKDSQSLNIPWTKDEMGTWTADMGPYILIATELAIVDLSIKAAWQVITADGQTLKKGLITRTRAIHQLMKGAPAVIDEAKAECVEYYIENHYIDEVIQKEILGCE